MAACLVQVFREAEPGETGILAYNVQVSGLLSPGCIIDLQS